MEHSAAPGVQTLLFAVRQAAPVSEEPLRIETDIPHCSTVEAATVEEVTAGESSTALMMVVADSAVVENVRAVTADAAKPLVPTRS
jgi:hypothetical protein